MGIARREGLVRVGGKCVDSQEGRTTLVRVGGKCEDSQEGGISEGWREVWG